MRPRVIQRIGLGLVVLVIATLLISVPVLASRSDAPAQRERVARPVSLAVTIELCASPGSATMPDSTSVPFWGFSDNTGGSCDPALLPGPELVVNEGDVLTINFENNLSENVALSFPGQSLLPDLLGAAPGGTVTYVFTATNPGTYLYETITGTQQVMGLSGALIVRPTLGASYAYSDTTTLFDVEQVLVLSEIDPLINAAIDAGTFPSATLTFLDYAPQYWLINGRAYGDTIAPDDASSQPLSSLIEPATGDVVLIRYLNAGAQHHTMQLLGQRQQVIARDAYPLLNPFSAVAETIASGQTADMLVTIPGGASTGDRYPLYSRQLYLTNGATSPGGMLTFIEVQ